MSEVTRILSQIESGDSAAAEQLLPLVYDELRKLAAAKLAQEKPGQTLQATALVHDAYLRLVDGEESRQWEGQGHFFAAAAEAMRRILIENARRKRSAKHGGDMSRHDVTEVQVEASELGEELLALDEALNRLAEQDQVKADLVKLRHFAGLASADPQAAELVKLRYFAGLSIDEAARALNISPRSADRLWAYARAWLRRAVSGS